MMRQILRQMMAACLVACVATVASVDVSASVVDSSPSSSKMLRLPAALFLPSFMPASWISSSSHLPSSPLSPHVLPPSSPPNVSSAQLNRLLTHLLGIRGESLGMAAAAPDAVWSHVTHHRRASLADANSLFAPLPQRSVVLLSGVDEPCNLVPSSSGAWFRSHAIDPAPSANEFASLLRSYERRADKSTHVEQSEALEHDDADVGRNHHMERWLDSARRKFDIVPDALAEDLFKLSRLFDTAKTGVDASNNFQTYHLSALADIARTKGITNEAYEHAKAVLLLAIDETLTILRTNSPSHLVALVALPADPFSVDGAVGGSKDDELLVPFVTQNRRSLKRREADNVVKRQLQQPSPSPRDYVGKCFATREDLERATAHCSSRGHGVESHQGAHTCWRCACDNPKSLSTVATSVTLNRRRWAGAACEKEDVSSPFVLLASTTLALILISVAAIAYLYSEGAQELPSVIAGVAIVTRSP